MIKVSGIGARTALAMLSGMEGAHLVQCIGDNDTAMLSKIPGIGKKTAERLIVEMRDKLGQLSTVSVGATSSAMPMSNPLADLPPAQQEAVQALISLGYKPSEAQKAVSKVANDETLTSQQLNAPLRASDSAPYHHRLPCCSFYVRFR